MCMFALRNDYFSELAEVIANIALDSTSVWRSGTLACRAAPAAATVRSAVASNLCAKPLVFFGVLCKNRRLSHSKQNVRMLWPKLHKFVRCGKIGIGFGFQDARCVTQERIDVQKTHQCLFRCQDKSNLKENVENQVLRKVSLLWWRDFEKLNALLIVIVGYVRLLDFRDEGYRYALPKVCASFEYVHFVDYVTQQEFFSSQISGDSKKYSLNKVLLA